MKTILILLFAGSFAHSFESEMVSTSVLLREDKIVTMAGGNSSSIGGDTADHRQTSAWFYGKKPIKTCFNRIETFGASEKRVIAAVKSSIKKWKSYFSKKQIKMNLNTGFVFSGKCKGNEDLVLHFGTGPIFGNLKDLKAAQSLSHPVAYVNKTHLSRDLKWSKGYIRFISQGYYSTENHVFPDWNLKNSLEAMVLHELGHVMGFSHIKGTIMSSNIAIKAFTKTPLPALIDLESELVFCESCREEFSLSPNSSNLAMLKKIGLSNRLVLVRKKTGFELIDNGRKIALNGQKVGSKTDLQVLNGNFSDFRNSARQRSFAVYSYFGSKKIPLILEYNSTSEQKGLLYARALINSEVVDLGIFHRLEN